MLDTLLIIYITNTQEISSNTEMLFSILCDAIPVYMPPRRHLVCNHCHSLVDFAVSGCGKTWSETTEEGFTFQCLGCWKVDCLTAELARLTDIVKGMESGGRVIARKTNGERTTGNMTCRKVTGEKVTVEKEGGTRGQDMREVDATGGKTNGRKEVRVDVTKRKSITRTMT